MRFKIFVLCMILFCFCFSVSGKTIYVDNDFDNSTDGWEDIRFKNIQSALDSAEVNDTIFVYIGYYPENIMINKSIKLVGEDKDLVIIDGNSERDVIIVNEEADNCFISNFSVTSEEKDYNYGIHVYSDNVNISNNIVFDNYHGIKLHYSEKSIVFNNFVRDNTNYGIVLDFSSNNNIFSNNVFSNALAGIYLARSDYNNIKNNKFISSSQTGLEFSSGSRHNKVNLNTFSGGRYLVKTCCNSNYNTFYANKFIISGSSIRDELSNNWDNGSIGNFWSDYQNKYPYANQSNGIWNTSYEVDENNMDRFPLVESLIPNEKPVVGISSPEKKDTVYGKTTVTGWVSDNDSSNISIEFKIDEGSWLNKGYAGQTKDDGMYSFSFFWETPGLSDGEHTISFRAYDGKEYSDVFSFDVNVSNKVGIPGFEIFIMICAIVLLLFKQKILKNY